MQCLLEHIYAQIHFLPFCLMQPIEGFLIHCMQGKTNLVQFIWTFCLSVKIWGANRFGFIIFCLYCCISLTEIVFD